jgi:hypothetical protein
MEKQHPIPTENLESNFYDFLNRIENNRRIFFSGRFGIGKTFFLKRFFDTHKDEYEVFHLFPVNYQISINEDIIDLLKYDILIELLKKDAGIFQSDDLNGISGKMSLFLSFLRSRGSMNDFLQWITKSGKSLMELSPDPVMQSMGKLGRPIQDLLVFDKEFQEFKKEYIEGDKGIIDKFISEVRKKNILEVDYLSFLLREKISQQKGGKKSVLILDDMDRIDPEHVFRILNIFSAHFDDEDNKFGFDHVIIVGDIKNIKSIFHHRYGKEADFSGYFDKFFTVKPYFLNNREVVAAKIPYLVEQIKCGEDNLRKSLEKGGGYIALLLIEVLSRALDIDKINLRRLYGPVHYNFLELKKGVFTMDHFRDNFQNIMDIGIAMLIAIFSGDKGELVSALQEIRRSIADNNDIGRAPYEVYIGSMVKSFVKPSPGMPQGWGSYRFQFPSDSQRYVDIDGDHAVKAKFFYDLLAEYVNQSKYIKSNYRDYEQ